MAWTRQARPRQARGWSTAGSTGSLIVLQTRSGEYAGLDGTALHVWELLAQCANLGELIDTLAAEYEVPRSECAPDIVPCLEGLLRQGLLVLDSHGFREQRPTSGRR